MNVLFIGIGVIAVIVIMFVLYVAFGVLKPKRLEQVERLIESGDTRRAITHLKTIIAKNERNALAHWYLAEAYRKEKRMEMALSEYKTVVRLSRYGGALDEKTVHYRMAAIYDAFNQLEESQKEYVIISNLDADDDEALFQIGRIFVERNLSENAMTYLSRALRVNPNRAETHFHVGVLHYQMKRIRDAHQSFAQALRLNPKMFDARFYLGMIHQAQKEYNRALAELELAQRSKGFKQRALLERGNCFINLESPDKAIIELERGLKFSQGEDAVTLAIRYALASCYEDARRLPEAIEQWEKIQQARPTYQDVGQKLALYEELRTDDRMKDFLIAGPEQFREMCDGLIKSMELTVLETELCPNEDYVIKATETSAKWRSAKKNNRLIKFRRTNEPVGEQAVREMHEEMRRNYIIRGIFVTTSKFSPSAIDYALTRPIDLIDKGELLKLLIAASEKTGNSAG